MSETSNLPELSVTELSGAIRRTMEDAFGYVRVRGEVSGYRGPHASGHAYFALKDATAKIDAIIWKPKFAALRLKPEEGMEVVATGRVTTYPGGSRYQIVIDTIEPAGVGALLHQIEERRKRLAAEGLFAAERKRPLPFLPEVIGVVTSPTGSVIRDILHRVADRFPRRVVVWPVRVQGEGSAEDVAGAIAGFNAIAPGGPLPQPDVLIVARGGGSVEDLWSFNDEAVVRAAAASAIPLISAVGHETDTTLIDLAADRRAPTPTGAAEMAVPVRLDLLAAVENHGSRLLAGVRRAAEAARSDLRGAARGLPRTESLLAGPRQRLDRAVDRLDGRLRRALEEDRRRLAELSRRLAPQSPAARLARFSERLGAYRARLATGLSTRIEREAVRLARQRERIEGASARLDPAIARLLSRRREHLKARLDLLATLGHRSVLARGYALVRDEAGRPVRTLALAAAHAALSIEFSDGALAVTAASAGAPPPIAPVRREREKDARKAGATEQGRLF
jgi:exodeoxyribonuclease VII large subunit